MLLFSQKNKGVGLCLSQIKFIWRHFKHLTFFNNALFIRHFIFLKFVVKLKPVLMLNQFFVIILF